MSYRRNYRWERPTDCLVSLSKFYSSEDPLFLGDSPSPVFTANREDPCSPRSQIGDAFNLNSFDVLRLFSLSAALKSWWSRGLKY